MSSIEKDGPYGIDVHAHRFAAWTASRAAGRGRKGLNNSTSRVILERCGAAVFTNADSLPDPNEIDSKHREWCEKARDLAIDVGLEITHGIAAKLINVYHKSRFVCSGHHLHPKVSALHPPIDSLLLANLAQAGVPGFLRSDSTAWSRFEFGRYQAVITNIRNHLGGDPMWTIEKYWDPAGIAVWKPHMSAIRLEDTGRS